MHSNDVCKMSVVSFALAVVFIIRLFSTSAFRVPKFIKVFETSVEYIWCEIISADDTASGEAVRYKRLLSGYI